MITITLSILKDDVLAEVAKTTAYTGAKMTDDDGAYDRIFTTEGDRAMLERFWDEAASAATESMKRFVTSIGDNIEETDERGRAITVGAGYAATLDVSGSYDTALTASVEKSLFSYFVNAIVGKWNNFTDKGEVARYEGEATAAMQDILSKLFYKKKPTRVIPK